MPPDVTDNRILAPDASQPGGEGPRVEGDLQYISTTLELLVDEAADLRERAEHGDAMRCAASFTMSFFPSDSPYYRDAA